MPVVFLIDTTKRIEQIGDVFFFDADSGIADGIYDVHNAVFGFTGLDGE